MTRSGEEECEWDLMQKLPDNEYMQKCILPVLYQGMRVIDFERPPVPLEALALFLLKHQDQIKLPSKEQKVEKD